MDMIDEEKTWRFMYERTRYMKHQGDNESGCACKLASLRHSSIPEVQMGDVAMKQINWEMPTRGSCAF
jgi:hypothetical protein